MIDFIFSGLFFVTGVGLIMLAQHLDEAKHARLSVILFVVGIVLLLVASAFGYQATWGRL